jgi:DNA-binding transcriptional ArsR family regulator
MTTDTLSLTFSALADPTRRAILARLASGEASVTELAAPFKMTLPAISKHLKVLERAGLIGQLWEERFDRLDAYLQTLQSQKGTASTEEKENLNA